MHTLPAFSLPLPLTDAKVACSQTPFRCKYARVAHRMSTGPVQDMKPLVRVRAGLPAVLVNGSGRISFVNGMGTNAFAAQMNDPVQTVFPSNIGRCIDIVTAVNYDDVVFLLTSLPEGELYKYLDRYIFPADDVGIEEFSIPKAIEVMTPEPEKIEPPDGMQLLPTSFGATIVHRALDVESDKPAPPVLSEWVSTLGTLVPDDSTWEHERILRGIPKMGQDVTTDNNPLEAGLWSSVSFEKGCYIGQETIARLNTYDGVKEFLCLIEFAGEVKVGDTIDGSGEGKRAAGYLTSVAKGNGGIYRALGYIREKSGLSGVGSEVVVCGVNGVTMDTPFLKKGYDSRSVLVL